MIENVIASLDQLDKLSGELRAQVFALALAATPPAPPLALAPSTPPAEMAQTTETSTIVEPANAAPAPAAGEPDNALSFKCPACGATYADTGQGAPICTNQHPAEQTLATADVLAGAVQTAPEAAQVDAPAATAPPAGEPAAASAAPVSPTWPA